MCFSVFNDLWMRWDATSEVNTNSDSMRGSSFLTIAKVMRMLNPSPDNVMRMQAGFCLFSVTEWVSHYILPSRKWGGGGEEEGSRQFPFHSPHLFTLKFSIWILVMEYAFSIVYHWYFSSVISRMWHKSHRSHSSCLGLSWAGVTGVCQDHTKINLRYFSAARLIRNNFSNDTQSVIVLKAQNDLNGSKHAFPSYLDTAACL